MYVVMQESKVSINIVLLLWRLLQASTAVVQAFEFRFGCASIIDYPTSMEVYITSVIPDTTAVACKYTPVARKLTTCTVFLPVPNTSVKFVSTSIYRCQALRLNSPRR